MNKKNSIECKAGEKIYAYGDRPQFAYLIISGSVSIFSSSGNNLGTIGRDEVFGEISSYLERTHSVTAIAKTNVIAIKIPKTRLKKIIKNTHPVIMGMLRSTYLRLSDSNEKNEVFVEEISKLNQTLFDNKENSDEIVTRINTIRKKINKNDIKNSPA